MVAEYPTDVVVRARPFDVNAVKIDICLPIVDHAVRAARLQIGKRVSKTGLS